MKVKKTALEQARTRYPNITEDELILMAQSAAPYTEYRMSKRFGNMAFQIEKRTVKRIHFLNEVSREYMQDACSQCGGKGFLEIPTETGNQLVPCRKC